MPYIGRAATNAGSVRYLDNIASGFDGSDTTFTAQVGGISITPDQESIYLYLDGVFQHPGSRSHSTIVASIRQRRSRGRVRRPQPCPFPGTGASRFRS